jgi:Carboxypeptidase regulatory-like domain
MNPTTGTRRTRISPVAVIVLLISIGCAGSAWALYPPDGAKQVNGAGPYFNPHDGICAVGLSAAGQMLVDWSITNARDCAAYTAGLATMSGVDVTATYGSSSTCCTTGSSGCSNANNVAGVLFWSTLGQKCYDTSACVIAGAKNSLCTAAGIPWTCCTGASAGSCMETNDNYKHAWSSSACVNPSTGQGISRAELDSDDSMCVSKGGTVSYAGACVAYGWQYLNRKPDGTLPVTGSGVSTTPGPAFSDGLGFCSTTIRMTGGTYTTANCPSNYNSATYAGLCTGAGVPYACCTGNGAGATCVGFNNACTAAGVPLACCTGPGTGSCSWTTGATCLSNANGCQTQAQYNAGLGWSYSASAGGCRYTYAVAGPLGGATVKADGTIQAAAALVDLTTPAYDTMGECLASGFTWDNWLPNTGTTLKTAASGGDFSKMPATATIRNLDAISSIEDGGGAFYSGTGAVCLKCHSDMSRAYMERDKPGFVETRHKLAGDAIGKPFQPYFDTDPLDPTPSPWGLKGVQCSMCHSTAKPAQDDLLQVNPAGAVNAGLPKSAAGHNNTEYGTHLIDLCYSCHGTAATPATTNPASVIPSTTTDFTLTSKGLAPIANQFLNSPHAAYIGSSTKVDVGNKNFYTSPFEGWNCRSAAGNLNRSYASSSACTGAGYTWYTTSNYGGVCYYSPAAASCTATGVPAACCTGASTGTCNGSCGNALNPTGVWTATFTSAAYPWARDTGGPGGVCYGVGLGSIQTTVYRNGAAEKIPNLDSTINTACTNAGDGSATSGADGWWIRDGETSPGDPATTDQGNCMTCHDVHWALASADPKAEPIRRECTTCHSNAGPSASNAPQVDVTRVNHLASAGTPLEHMLTDPDLACETCHMPKSSASGSRMHLFRINTAGSYQTMGAGQVNTVADGAYTTAGWVDIDHACGQCHYTSGVVNAGSHPTWPVFTRGQLAVAAKGMHPAAASSNPAPSATQTCASTPAEANAWTVTVTDTSPNPSYIAREAVNWADGSVVADDRIAPFGPFSHAYIDAGTYPILHTIVDTIGQVSQSTCNVTWSYFTIGGTVTDSRLTCVGGTTPGSFCSVDADCPGSVTPPVSPGTCTGIAHVAGASVRVTSNANGLVAGNAVTGATGAYTVGALKPGTYTVTFSLAGYAFTTPAAVTIGPSATLVNSIGTVSLAAVRPPKVKTKTPGVPHIGPSAR